LLTSNLNVFDSLFPVIVSEVAGSIGVGCRGDVSREHTSHNRQEQGEEEEKQLHKSLTSRWTITGNRESNTFKLEVSKFFPVDEQVQKND
jgi:hypothetical protein